MTNIEINGSFENGWTDFNESIQIPNGWTARWADRDTPNPYSPDPWNQFVPPEIVHKLRHQLPPDEQDLFILDGDTTLKVFKGHGAWCAELTHPLTLEPGTYTYTVRIFGDLVSLTAGGRKYWAADPNSGLLRFVLNGHAYDDLHSITAGVWNVFSIEFAADGDTSFGVQVMCPFALENSGVFLDAWSLAKGPSDGQCEAPARVPYAQIIHVYDPAEGREAYLDACATVWDDYGPQHIGPSSDAPFVGCGLGSKRGVWHHVTADKWPDYLAFGNEYYPKVEIEMERRPWGDTPTPSPSPPPPPEPEPLNELLSIHLQTEVTGWLEYVRKVKPQWVKLVGNMELARQIKSVSPATKVLFRHHVQHNDPYLNNPDKTAAASDFLALFWDSLRLNARYIDAIEGLNETIATHDILGIRKAVDFGVALSDELARRNIGVVAALLGTAIGNPAHGEETAMLLPAAEAAVRNNGYLHYHPYFPCTPLLATRWMESEWEHHHGRALASWDVTFAKFGVEPRYLFTEGGAVGATVRSDGRPGALNANAGWKYSGCLNGNLDHYLALLLRFRQKVNLWNAAHDNRAETLTIFTTGAAFIGWPDFLFNTNELSALEAALE